MASDSSGSSSNAARTIIYRKYDPSVKNRRVSQLSNGASSPAAANGSGSSTTRVLGAVKPAVIVSPDLHPHSPRSSISSQDGILGSASPSGSSSGIYLAGSATSTQGEYFDRAHSESTAPQISVRQREREKLHAGHAGRPESLKSQNSSQTSSTAHTPSQELSFIPNNGDYAVSSPRTNVTSSSLENGGYRPNTPPRLATHAGTISNGSSNTIQPAANASPASVPKEPQFLRSQSAMAALQPSSSTSTSIYKPFIPPSAYVTTPNSTASSPGVGSMGQHVASQLSSAFAKGISNVNGVVNGTAPVRLPPAASQVANAVWNRLPPAFQLLRDDSFDSSTSSVFYTDPGRSSTPPSAARSQSMSNLEGPAGRPFDSRPGSSSGVSQDRIQHLSPQHPTALPLAAQLRLEVANKQLNGAAHPAHSRDSSTSSSVMQARPKAPYKPGYQPKNGVWRTKTDEFLESRRRKVSSARRGSKELNGVGAKVALEEERLLRRLDKIVELHFPAGEPANSHPASLTRSGSDMSITSRLQGAPVQRQTAFRRTSDVFGKVLKGVTRGPDIRGTSRLEPHNRLRLTVPCTRRGSVSGKMARRLGGPELSNMLVSDIHYYLICHNI